MSDQLGHQAIQDMPVELRGRKRRRKVNREMQFLLCVDGSGAWENGYVYG